MVRGDANGPYQNVVRTLVLLQKRLGRNPAVKSERVSPGLAPEGEKPELIAANFSKPRGGCPPPRPEGLVGVRDVFGRVGVERFVVVFSLRSPAKVSITESMSRKGFGLPPNSRWILISVSRSMMCQSLA